MSKKLKWQTFVWALCFFAVSMSVMLVHARDKVIMVTDVAQDQIAAEEFGVAGEQTGQQAERPLRLAQAEGDRLTIPLEAGVKAEDVTIENHYMDRELWIYIKGTGEDFYSEEEVSGRLPCIRSGTYDTGDGSVLLKFALDGIYECRNELQENLLYIELVVPWEIYDKIVVIDPSCGGEDTGLYTDTLTEKEITLDIAKRLKAKLDQTDIKVYYTRMEDKNPLPTERIALANGVRADMFIGISLNGDSTDGKKYGTEAVYNADYFIPGFGSVELADLAVREVVMSVSGRGNGLIPAGEADETIWNAEVPAVELKAGYMTNPQEAALLEREDYRERVAEGICNAILKAFE